MKISATREQGAARLALEGRLDREGAEQLSGTLETLLRDGVRSLRIDLSGVSYLSSPATQVLSRWREELALLRGEVRLTAVPPAVQDAFALTGYAHGPDTGEVRAREPKRSSWHTRADLEASGQYEVSAIVPAGRLDCRLHGDPGRMTQARLGASDCSVVQFPEGSFGLGLGAIGERYDDTAPRFGELAAAGGCIAYFPSDGARLADYLVAAGGRTPRAVLASGLSCSGGFSHRVRFGTRPEAAAIPFSEVVSTALDATGSRMAGLVIAAEVAGLSGARLRRSPATAEGPLLYSLPALRDWLLFAPERTHSMTTAVIVGVVARAREGALAAHLRPLGLSPRLFGHFHAAVFGYRPLPWRTVELAALLQQLFGGHQLRDVLHLLQDHRSESGVRESELLRGVAWAAPATLTD